jgi:type III secretory pathway component EscV
LAADIVASIRLTVGDLGSSRAVLVTQPDVRRWLRDLIAPELPGLAVLSYSELAHETRVERRAPVRVHSAA